MDDKLHTSVHGKDGEIGPYAAYALVALVSALGSAAVALVVFVLPKWSNLTDSGLWALSAAVFAPSAMGVGVSYMIYRTSCARLDAIGRHRPDADSRSEYGIRA